MPVKQVIVCRTRFSDGKGGFFGLRLGKMCAQVAHASMKVFLDQQLDRLGGYPIDYYLEAEHERGKISDAVRLLVVPLTRPMNDWVTGDFTKVVVGVETEEDLLRCHALAKEAGLPTALIQDIGATEFHGVPTYTTCAIGPAEVATIDRITGPDGLVRVKLL